MGEQLLQETFTNTIGWVLAGRFPYLGNLHDALTELKAPPANSIQVSDSGVWGSLTKAFVDRAIQEMIDQILGRARRLMIEDLKATLEGLEESQEVEGALKKIKAMWLPGSQEEVPDG